MDTKHLIKRVKIWITVSFACLAPATADDVGFSWTRVDAGQTESITEVSWDGSTFVGVGSRGLIATSNDGKSWDEHFQRSHPNFSDIAWNGTSFVAVGPGTTLLGSADGKAWENITLQADSDFTSVTWTGLEFIALDSSIYLSTSPDGITWTRGPGTIPSAGHQIESFDGFTYVITTGGIQRSSDLESWTQVLSASGLSEGHIRQWDDTLFCVGSSRIYSSEDGVTWSSASFVDSPPSSVEFRDIVWSGTRFVAFGNSTQIWTSQDGLEWSSANTLADDHDYGYWNGNEIILGDFASPPETSPDGLEWSQLRPDLHYPADSTVWTGVRYVTVGNHGHISTYSDSEPWSSHSSGTISNLVDIIWTGSFALASGDSGIVLKSGDGLTWEKTADGLLAGTVRVVWTGSQAFAFGSNGVFASSDGVIWSEVPGATLPSNLTNLTWHDGMFIGVGGLGKIVTSPDAVAWTSVPSGTTATLFTIGRSNTEFLIGGANGTLLASTDGSEWEPRSIPSVSVSDLEYRLGRWFLASTQGILQSTDGITWEMVSAVSKRSAPILEVHFVWNGSRLICTSLNAETVDGITWNQRPAQDHQTLSFYAVAKRSGEYVAVGEAGQISYSNDGYQWSAVTNTIEENLNAIVAGGGRWIAVGNSGMVVSSLDGMDWTTHESGTTEDLLDIAWNGSLFATTGKGGALLTSVDGQQWSSQLSDFTATIATIEASGSQFKAIASGGTVIDSPDGVSWNIHLQRFITDVVWNGSFYLAVGDGGLAYVSSPDALVWTSSPMGTSASFSGVCWTGSLFVATGSSGTIATSSDGVVWTLQTSGTTEWIQGVNWNNTQLVAVGHGGTILTSPDGMTWTDRSPVGYPDDYEDIIWANEGYVVVGRQGAFATSSDGTTWQKSGVVGDPYTVEWIGDRFIVHTNRIYSYDGTRVVSETSGLNATVFDLEWNDGDLFAATYDGIQLLKETRPKRWSAELVFPSPQLDNMTRNGSEYVATGRYGTILLSRDGIGWEMVNGGRTDNFFASAWNGSRFVGVASNRLEVSPDANRWNVPSEPLPRSSFSLVDVIWTGSRFIAVGPRSIFISTPDAESWIEAANYNQSPSSLYSIAGDDEQLVAVGYEGIIMVSDGLGESTADYETWIANQGDTDGLSAPLQDANDDGISNLLAYIHGIPAVGTLSPADRLALPSASFNPSEGEASFSFELRESYRPGATYVIEMSTDLTSGNWQIVQQYDGAWSEDPSLASISETLIPGNGLRIKASNFPDSADPGRCFLRLRATLP